MKILSNTLSVPVRLAGRTAKVNEADQAPARRASVEQLTAYASMVKRLRGLTPDQYALLADVRADGAAYEAAAEAAVNAAYEFGRIGEDDLVVGAAPEVAYVVALAHVADGSGLPKRTIARANGAAFDLGVAELVRDLITPDQHHALVGWAAAVLGSLGGGPAPTPPQVVPSPRPAPAARPQRPAAPARPVPQQAEPVAAMPAPDLYTIWYRSALRRKLAVIAAIIAFTASPFLLGFGITWAAVLTGLLALAGLAAAGFYTARLHRLRPTFFRKD